MMSGHAMMGNAGANHALGNMGSHGGHPQSNTPVDMATTYSQLGGMMQGGALDMSGLNQSGLVAQMGQLSGLGNLGQSSQNLNHLNQNANHSQTA